MTDAKLLKKRVNFNTESGKSIVLDAVYEESLPTGTSIGTVVAFHGSPGSHKDFKYIRDKLNQRSISFIGVNYPGYSITDGYEGQLNVNPERENFTNALLDELNIQGKLIIMGHSRGCDNALMTATNRPIDGLVMINPIGLRIHKGIRPVSKLRRIEWIYDNLPKVLGDAMMYRMYKRIGLKAASGEEAINAMKTVLEGAFERLIPFIEKLGKQDTKTFVICGGKDFLIEKEINYETLKKYEWLQFFDFVSDISPDETTKILKTFENGRGATVFVEKDTHFQNKLRAELVADVVKKIVETTGNMSKL